MRSYKFIKPVTPIKSIFQDRRTIIDRRALFNMDVKVNNDKRSYRDRRNWGNFTLKRDWWLQVNYVESENLTVVE